MLWGRFDGRMSLMGGVEGFTVLVGCLRSVPSVAIRLAVCLELGLLGEVLLTSDVTLLGGLIRLFLP